jgi:ferritin-like protein
VVQDVKPNEAGEEIVEFHRSSSCDSGPEIVSRYREPILSPSVSGHQPKARRTIMASASDRNPQHHTQAMRKRLQEIVTHLREDIQKVDEPQLKAMFETSAEVLNGLMKAFSDYEKKNESAWRKSA